MNRRRCASGGVPRVFVAVVAAVALVAGCNSSSGNGKTSRSPSAHHGSAKRTESGTTYSVGGEKYRVSVSALYRSGPFTRLGFKVTCVQGTSDNSRRACEADQDFTAGVVGLSADFGDFYLVDPVRHKKYLPVKDGSEPFTSKSDFIDKGKTDDGWAVFPAAAKQARSLDVVIPEGPVLEDVPIGRPEPKTQQAPTQPNFDKPKDTTDASGLDLPVSNLKLHTTSEATDAKQSKDRENVTLAADVLFAFGKATLTGKAKTILDRVATRMDSQATGTIDVTGYTDSKGSPTVNTPLSKHRAKAVSDYLKTKVKHDQSYSVTGKGEADPVAPNTKDDGSDNPKGRAKNRRVTVSYKVKQATQQPGANPSRRPTRSAKAPAAINWTATGAESTDTYQVAAQRVQRHGDFAALHFTLTCKKPEDSDQPCRPEAQLQDPGHSGVLASARAGGFRLYDTSTKTRYYPVTDDTSDPKEWTSDTDVSVDTGKKRSYWAYFPAPDANVTSIDVELPHGGPTIHNVPVE